jgi:uncharacterized protein
VTRVRVPVAFTRIDRIVLAVVLVLAAGGAAIVWITDGIVAPPRPRVSESSRPMVGLALRAEGGGLVVRRSLGPARQAGLLPGDRIVEFGGLRDPDVEAVARRVGGCADGEIVRVEARRGPAGPGETAVLADVKVVVQHVSPADEGLAYADVAFRNAQGLTLRGWYIPPPAAGSGRAPAIAWGHGNASDRRQWLPVAAAVHEAGMAQMLFDFRGRGDSDGEVISLGAHEAGDMRAALDALAARPEVDPLRLATGGKSMGASAALIEAAGDARVKALVLDSPFADLIGVVDHTIAAYHLPPAIFGPVLMKVAGWRAGYDPWGVRPVDDIAKIKAPILLFHGDADTLIPFADARRLTQAAGGRVTLVPLHGLDHNSRRPDDLGDRVAAFLTSVLAR